MQTLQNLTHQLELHFVNIQHAIIHRSVFMGCNATVLKNAAAKGECCRFVSQKLNALHTLQKLTPARTAFSAVHPALQRQLKVATLIVHSRQELVQDGRFS